MTLGLLFWILMILWFFFGVYVNRAALGNWQGWGGSLLEFVLFLLLGWHAFGAPIHG